MKFFQLPIGARFEYRGQAFTKSGPLVATNEADGSQKLMVRSANVNMPEPASGRTPAEPPANGPSLERVQAAFDVFYRACEQLLDESGSGGSGESMPHLKQRLQAQRERFLERLAEPQKPVDGQN